MRFLTSPGAPLYSEQLQARALHAWRDAEELVAERWRMYTTAERETRRGAYAAYVFALGAEAAAAAELAAVHLTEAA